jgi:hypothetical protein
LRWSIDNRLMDGGECILKDEVTANVLLNSQILLILTKVALRSSGTSVLTRATWRNIPEFGILHIHRRQHLKSYR